MIKECKRCRTKFEVTKQEKLYCSLICCQKMKAYFTKYYKEHKEEMQLKYQQHRKENIEYSRKYRKKHREHYRKYQEDYRQKYPQKTKMYRETHKKEASQYKKQYSQKNREKINELSRKYRRNPIIRIVGNLRHRVWSLLKNKNKSKSTLKLIGCSLKQLKQHLETQFKKGMNWKNYGRYGWHIDHIRPCYSFDLSKESQQRKCFNYRNLQPLWAIENLSKWKKLSNK